MHQSPLRVRRGGVADLRFVRAPHVHVHHVAIVTEDLEYMHLPSVPKTKSFNKDPMNKQNEINRIIYNIYPLNFFTTITSFDAVAAASLLFPSAALRPLDSSSFEVSGFSIIYDKDTELQ